MPSDDAPPRRRGLLPRRIVLTFHGLGEPGPDIDAAERPYWLDPASFAATLARANGMQGVEITFDDGYRSDVEIALPMLAAAGLTATFFVLAGRLGQPGALGGRDLATLARHGMSIGSHGQDHVDWTRAPAAAMRRELYDARARIEDAAGIAVRTLSVPFGAFDSRILALAAEAGYAAVHTSSGGLAGAGDWLVPRNTIRRGIDPGRLLDRLAAWPARLDSALRNPLRAWKHGASGRVSTSPEGRDRRAA